VGGIICGGIICGGIICGGIIGGVAVGGGGGVSTGVGRAGGGGGVSGVSSTGRGIVTGMISPDPPSTSLRKKTWPLHKLRDIRHVRVAAVHTMVLLMALEPLKRASTMYKVSCGNKETSLSPHDSPLWNQPSYSA
jgi:hypothetical protein